MSRNAPLRALRALDLVTLSLVALVTHGCSCSGTDPMLDAGGLPDAEPDTATPGLCGNGLADEGEICDPSVTEGGPEARCACDDGNACTTDRCKSGTSAEACTCDCEHVARGSGHMIDTCDDGDACTTDVMACAASGDPRTPEACAAACEITCTNTPVTPCAANCGNGVIDAGETCEVFVPGVSPPHLSRCVDCDDDNPCTLDTVGVGGSPESCDVPCVHTPIAANTYGVTTCNDGKTCTQDVIVSGSPLTCDVSCQHIEVPNWAIVACNDGDACTNDVVLAQNPATCAVTCSNTAHTGYPYTGCDDGIACTVDMQGMWDDGTCQFTCTHTGSGGYDSTHCDDDDACTTDTIVSGAPATCDVDCAHHDTRDDADLPDLDDSFDDTNCDGVDGDAATLVFVSTDGNDTTGQGTRAQPFATIGRGITFAATNGRAHVAVSAGTYAERVVIASGVSIHGGYARHGAGQNSWTRATTSTTTISVPPTLVVGGRVEAIFAQGIDEKTQIDRFVVVAGSPSTAPSAAGTSVYGIRIVGSTPGAGGGLELHHVTASAGRGAPGAMGVIGTTGEMGTRGGDAMNRNPGSGSVQQCGTGADVGVTQGGGGGTGGRDTAGAVCWGGNPGTDGVAPAPSMSCMVGTGGAGADSCSGGGSSAVGQPGSSSCEGPGADGNAASGIATRGAVVTGAWSSTGGQSNGTRGSHGVGGSGGGGGGSGNCWSLCTGPDGGGGGGGGSGGCGGYPGTGGGGGGGSFGLFVVDSSVIAVSSTFASAQGGAGGTGGDGGLGGEGGGAGNGAGGSCPTNGAALGKKCSSAGGAGGQGRAGGRAGGAGGGAGGPSIAQFACRSSVTGISESTGTPGAPGAAGTGGLPNGPAGLAGSASALRTSMSADCGL